MTLVNHVTDDERTGDGAEQPSDVVVLDLRLREVEAFGVLREMAGTESPHGRPTRALAVRCLAARVTAPSDELRRALAFSEFLEWRIDDLTRTGDALGLL